MIKYCNDCKREYPEDQKRCPICGGKLEKWLTEQERIDKENDDFTVINTLLP